MNSRERVLRAINHEQPDRCPIFATLTTQVADKLAEALNIPKEPAFDSLLSPRMSHNGLLTMLGNDCAGIAACYPRNFPSRTEKNGTIVNEWGMRLKPFGLYNELAAFPLSCVNTVKDLDSHEFPDPFAEGRFDAAKKLMRKYSKDYAIVANLECLFFEIAWYLVGLEKFLMDLLMEKEYTLALLDRILEINTKVGIRLIEMGADVIWAGDDFGTQKGMLMSPELWRKVFKPRIRKTIAEFKKVNPAVKVAWHSCGSIVPIIGDFIDIGLDILNPIQPLAAGMAPKFLKDTYGNSLTFFGGIDIQELLPRARPGEVKKEVKRIANIMGKGGGYIVAPAHHIQNDTPLENIFALFEAVKELG